MATKELEKATEIIKISASSKDKLDELKKGRETYDDLVNRLIANQSPFSFWKEYVRGIGIGIASGGLVATAYNFGGGIVFILIGIALIIIAQFFLGKKG